MPDDSKTAPSPKSKPITRSSIRQSLGLASVGKAFADAMSKDGREASKNAKKTREASRRSSILSPAPSAPRASMGDVRPPSQVSKRNGTPESKTITRRRVSASYTRSSSDEQPLKSPEPTTPQAAPNKSSTLRPRNLNATSALPKYRPKSVVLDIPKPPSPVRTGTRRRLSTSEDEKKEQNRPQSAITPSEKVSRPISPLPHRAALKTNLTNSMNATPPGTPTKPKLSTPSGNQSSPSRPTKIIKTTASTAIARPPSSSSSSTSLHPNTPKTSTPKNSGNKGPFAATRSAHERSKSAGTSSTASPWSRDSPSPSARHARKTSKLATPATSSAAGNMSHISEGNTEDSEDEDVELLLAPVAALGAPTPAMPRIRKRIAPQTPTRQNLPTRSNMSYLSPLPPDSDEQQPSLRPPQRTPRNERAMRGSILSFEQLAANASETLDQDELGRLLSDIPAPFRSGAASPSLSSQMDVPGSPCLSAIDSPGGYGSISQVMLPEVTPSPAVNYNIQQSRFSLSPDVSTVDASAVTMLRLRLASADNTARSRLEQVQAMEEEIYNLKQSHMQQMEEMQKQMAYMEMQGRASDEQASYATSLEEQLRGEHAYREQAIQEAVIRSRDSAYASYNHAMESHRRQHESTCSARLAAVEWGAVRDACEIELDVVRGDRAVLDMLLAQVDQMCQVL